MKYLLKYKIFESFTEEDVEAVFESYINWELVKDLEDRALEYLDKGLSLNIIIYYDTKNIYLSTDIPYNSKLYRDRGWKCWRRATTPIYDIQFTHKQRNSSWHISKQIQNLTEGPYELEDIKSEKIIYYFVIADMERNLIIPDESSELMELVSSIYPDENIQTFYSE